MLPDLPQRWVVDAFRGMVPYVPLGLGPGGGEVVVWRRPGSSGVRID